MTTPTSLFFFGSLRHQPVLDAVLGRPIDGVPAQRVGHASFFVEGAPFSALRADPQGSVEGVLVRGLSANDAERIDFYAGSIGHGPQPVTVEAAQGQETALAYVPRTDPSLADRPWDLDDWVAQWGDVAVLAAKEVMVHFGRRSAEEMAASYPQILARASSSVRAAAEPAPVRFRRATSRDTVELLAERRPYLGYFGIGECDLRFPLFDGGKSATVKRAAFLSADAVTVLPYDPKRDRVLLIEQFRFGPYLRGDPYPWALEPIAGRIDPGETPEDAARRETVEEAGLQLGALHEVGRYYPSPGAVAEWLVSYIAIADLPDEVAGIFGLESEAEDILSHVLSFSQLMELVDSGEIAVGPLLLSAQWIALNRDRLTGVS